ILVLFTQTVYCDPPEWTPIRLGVLPDTFSFPKINNVNGLSVGLPMALDGNMNGLQIGPLGAGASRVRGLQVGGLIVATDDLIGIEIGGFANLPVMYAPITKIRGLQVAAVNYGQTVFGIQAGGINGITKLVGIQLGAVNLIESDTMSNESGRGLQLGVINICTHQLRGVQIGLYNSADSLYGVQLGLINRIKSHRRLKIVPLMNMTF